MVLPEPILYQGIGKSNQHAKFVDAFLGVEKSNQHAKFVDAFRSEAEESPGGVDLMAPPEPILDQGVEKSNQHVKFVDAFLGVEKK